MSHIELDEFDGWSVRRAREALAKSEADGVAGRSSIELCRTIGSLEYHLGSLLKMLDGGEER